MGEEMCAMMSFYAFACATLKNAIFLFLSKL